MLVHLGYSMSKHYIVCGSISKAMQRVEMSGIIRVCLSCHDTKWTSDHAVFTIG